jgi:hypothetical protein
MQEHIHKMSNSFPHVTVDNIRVGHVVLVSHDSDRQWVRVERIDDDGDITGVDKEGNDVVFLREHVRDARVALCVEDYRRALLSQTACNGLALTTSLADVLPRIVSEMLFEERAYDDALKHPIYKLMLLQLSYLAFNSASLSMAAYQEAVTTCEAFIRSSEIKSSLGLKTT